jgi:hypothetical protein
MPALIGVGSIVGIRTADSPKAGCVLVQSFIVSALALSLYPLLMPSVPINAEASVLSWMRGPVLFALSLGMIVGRQYSSPVRRSFRRSS